MVDDMQQAGWTGFLDDLNGSLSASCLLQGGDIENMGLRILHCDGNAG